MKKNFGFTLVEMLITIAIMGILAVTALPNINLRDTSQTQLDMTVRQVADQISLVKTWSQTGTVPANQDLSIPLDKYKIKILANGLEVSVRQTTGAWQVVKNEMYDGYDFEKVSCELIFDPRSTVVVLNDPACLTAGENIFTFGLTKQSSAQRRFVSLDLRTGLVQ